MKATTDDDQPAADRTNGPDSKVTTIIFCTFFDRPWRHVHDSYEGEMPYRSNAEAHQRNYVFRLINLPMTERLSTFGYLVDYHRIPRQEPFSEWFPLKSAVLELEVPVNHLQKLFRNERKNLVGHTADFVDDILQQHLMESGRVESKGPDTLWLLNYAKSYLEHFIMEVGNRIIEAYTRDYEDLPFGYIDKWKVDEETVVVNRYENGAFGLGSFGLQGKPSFNLTGEWRAGTLGLLQISQPDDYPTHYGQALRRVRLLLKAGLHMEALSLLNAFLEVHVMNALVACISKHPEAQKVIQQMNHRKRLEILRVVAAEADDVAIAEADFQARVKNAARIYKHRNDYVHALVLPESGKDWYLGVKQRRDLEELMHGFTDPYESRQWLFVIELIAQGNDNGTVRILQEAARFPRSERRRSGCVMAPSESMGRLQRHIGSSLMDGARR